MLQRFPALASKNLRLFLIGQIVSLSGTWMHSVAQSWLVYSLTKSAFWLGAVAVASSLPILLFSLFGGFIADKYPKKKILLFTQVFSILPPLVLGLLIDLQLLKVWHVIVLASTLGIINAVDIPTRQSFLGEIAGKQLLVSAIGLNSAVFNTARIVGPLLAGFVIEHFNLSVCFYLNALSFIPVAVIISKFSSIGATTYSGQTMFSEILQALRYVTNDRCIFAVIFMIAVLSLFGIPFITVLPLLTAEVLNKSAGGLSVLIASSGVGSVLSALSLAMRSDIKGKGLFLFISSTVFCVALFAIAMSYNFYLTLCLMFLAGFGVVSCISAGNSFIQQAIPDSMRGRIMSLYTFVFLGLAPIGNSIVAILAEFLGVMSALKILAVICFGGSLLFIKFYRRPNVIACS